MIAVEWNIIPYCDNNCPYCIERDNITRGVKDVEVDIERDDKIFDFLMSLENGFIEFCSGEATLHPKSIYYFNELCKHSSCRIHFDTHGNISDEKIDEFDCHGKEDHMIAISYHPTQVEFDVWFDKVLKLNKKLNVYVVMVLNNQWNSSEEVKKIQKHGISVQFRQDIFDDFEGDDQTVKSRPIIKNRVVCKSNSFRIDGEVLMISCLSGHKSIRIDDNYEEVCKFMDNHLLICPNDICPVAQEHVTLTRLSSD